MTQDGKTTVGPVVKGPRLHHVAVHQLRPMLRPTTRSWCSALSSRRSGSFIFGKPAGWEYQALANGQPFNEPRDAGQVNGL